MSRIAVGVTPAQKAEIQHRAGVHGIPVAAFMRKAALGTHGAPEDDPDAWWDTLSPSRKKSIREWLTARKDCDRPTGDPLPFDE